MSDTNLNEAKKSYPSTISSASENPINQSSTPSSQSLQLPSCSTEGDQNIAVKVTENQQQAIQSESNVSDKVKSNMIVSAASTGIDTPNSDQPNLCNTNAGHNVGGNEKDFHHTSDKESSPERSHPTVGVSGLSSDTCSSVEFTWNEEVSRTTVNIVSIPERTQIDTVHIEVPKVEISEKIDDDNDKKATLLPLVAEKRQSSPSPPPLPPKIRHSKSAETTGQPLIVPNYIRPTSPKRSRSHEFRENIEKTVAKVEPIKKLIPILKSPRQSHILLFTKDDNNPVPPPYGPDTNCPVRNTSHLSPKMLVTQKSHNISECTKNKSVQTNDVSLSSSSFLAVPAVCVPSSERSRSPHSPQHHSARRKARLSRKCKLASSHVPATGSGPTSPYRQILTSSSSAEEDDEQLEPGGYGGSGGGGGGGGSNGRGTGGGGCSKHTGEDGEHSSSSGLLKAKSDESFDHYRASSSNSSSASRVGKRTQRYYRRKSQEFIFKPLNLVNPIRLADQRPSIEVISSDSESDTGVIPCRISAPSNTVQWVQSRAYSPRTMERHAQEAKRIAEQNRLNSSSISSNSNTTVHHHQYQYQHQPVQRLSSDAQYPPGHSASLDPFDSPLLDSAPYHSHVWTPARTCYNRQPSSVSSDPVASKRIDFRCLDDVLPEFSSSDPVIFPHHHHHHPNHPINLSNESRLPMATSQPLHLNHHYHHLYQHLSPNNDSGVSSQSVASSPILSQAPSPHLKLSTQKLSPPGAQNFSCSPEKPARSKYRDHVEQMNQKPDDMRPKKLSSPQSREQIVSNSNKRSPFERINNNNVSRPRSQPEHLKDLDSKMMTIELRQSVKDLIGGIERGLKTANQAYKNLRNSKSDTKIKSQTVQEEDKRTSPIIPAPRIISNRSLSAFHTPLKSIDSNNNTNFRKADSNVSDRSLTKSQSFPLNDRSSTGLTNHVNSTSIIKNGQSQSRSILNSGKAFFEPTRREDFLNRMKFFEKSSSSVPNQANATKQSAQSLLLKEPVADRYQNGHPEVNGSYPIVRMNQVNGHSSKVHPMDGRSNAPAKSTGKFVRLMDDQRNLKCAKSQSNNDLLNNSVKLDEALSELEEIYASLNLEADEDLLDRAERRDIPSKFQLLRYQQSSNNCDQKLNSNNNSISSHFKSYPPVEGKLYVNSRPNSAQSEASRRLSIHENGDPDRPTPTPSDPGTTRCLIPSETGWNHPYCDNFSNRRSLGNVEAILAGYDPPYRQRTPPRRRSAIPDPVGDDLANRRMYQNPPPPQPDDDKKIPSYMLISPYYTPSSGGGRDLLEEMANEPDIQKDDLSYRKYVQAESAHMHVPSPHPPFGIPAGITDLSTSNNYVNAQVSEADRNWVYKRVKPYYPHLVKDDLAYRNYRKDFNRVGPDTGRESSPKLMPVTSKHLIDEYRVNGRLPFASKNG